MVLKKQPKRNYWKEEEEGLLKQWADKSQCYQWMHTKSREYYQKKNAMYTIPVIIISTLTGTANFAQERFSDKAKPIVSMVVGSLSIIAGIITTVYQFLKISELIRPPLDRISANEYIKTCKEEYNRLVEISPFIPKKILNLFNSKFKDTKGLVKPEIGDIINPTDIFIMDLNDRNKMVEELNKDITIQNDLLIKKETDKFNKIEKFKNSFYNLNRRYPTKHELEKNIKYIEEEIVEENSFANNLEQLDTESNLDNISELSNNNFTNSIKNYSSNVTIDIEIPDTNQDTDNDQRSKDVETDSNVNVI